MNYIIIILLKVLVLKAHTCAKSAKSNPKNFNKGDIQGRTLWREKSEKENQKKEEINLDAVSVI